MKKPKYLGELLKIIFFWLSIAFACTAILSYIGVLQPNSNSLIQEPAVMGLFFLVIGFIFALASSILGMITANKNKQHAELLTNGTRLTGAVEKVYLQKYIQYGNQSPYIIQYVYTYQDRVYHHKSCFLWEKPNLMVGDSITVCADDCGRSIVLL